MKVLIVSTYDISGGAAKAAYRLHIALLKSEIDSKIYVLKKDSDDNNVIGYSSLFLKLKFYFRFIISKIPLFFYKKYNKKNPFSFQCKKSNKYFIKLVKEFNPDIVHLHWINDNLLSLDDIKRIKKPIVWSLHDMWPFTGGCHYSGLCEKYKLNGCSKCEVLGSNNKFDLSYFAFRSKMRIFSKSQNTTIIGLSQWIANLAANSLLFNRLNVINLPNCIDTSLYHPISKNTARSLFNLPLNKKLILFGAMDPTSDPRKGYKELISAIQKISKDSNFELVILGTSNNISSISSIIKTYYVGILKDDVSLITLYSAVDMVVVPSLQENLSNIIIESMSCGTPVVAFNIGGNSDIIDHKTNGYLSLPFDSIDLLNGIYWVSSNLELLQTNSRNKVILKFDSRLVSKSYTNLYTQILEGKKTK